MNECPPRKGPCLKESRKRSTIIFWGDRLVFSGGKSSKCWQKSCTSPGLVVKISHHLRGKLNKNYKNIAGGAALLSINSIDFPGATFVSQRVTRASRFRAAMFSLLQPCSLNDVHKRFQFGRPPWRLLLHHERKVLHRGLRGQEVLKSMDVSRFATAKRHQMCWHTLDTCVCCDLPMEEAMMGFCPASWRTSPQHRAWYEAWPTCMGCSSAFRLCMQCVTTVTTSPGNASATPSGDSKTQSCTIFSCSDWEANEPPSHTGECPWKT